MTMHLQTHWSLVHLAQCCTSLTLLSHFFFHWRRELLALNTLRPTPEHPEDSLGKVTFRTVARMLKMLLMAPFAGPHQVSTLALRRGHLGACPGGDTCLMSLIAPAAGLTGCLAEALGSCPGQPMWLLCLARLSSLICYFLGRHTHHAFAMQKVKLAPHGTLYSKPLVKLLSSAHRSKRTSDCWTLFPTLALCKTGCWRRLTGPCWSSDSDFDQQYDPGPSVLEVRVRAPIGLAVLTPVGSQHGSQSRMALRQKRNRAKEPLAQSRKTKML